MSEDIVNRRKARNRANKGLVGETANRETQQFRATRYLSSMLQISGFKWQRNRLRRAFQRGDTRDGNNIRNPQSMHRGAFTIGILACVLIGAIAGFLAWQKPRSSKGSSSIILTAAGGYYVMYNDVLHPVTNLASARLITESAKDAKVVRNGEINNYPRGLLMGIPAAPNSFQTNEDTTAQWNVCDVSNPDASLSLIKTDGIKNILIAGRGSLANTVTPLNTNVGVYVHENNDRRHVYLLYNNFRTEVNLRDLSLLSALRVTETDMQSTIPVSRNLLNAIPLKNLLTTPIIPSRHMYNQWVRKAFTGDVIVSTPTDSSVEYFVVLKDGVQKINSFISQLLLNSGSKNITDMSVQELSNIPHISSLDLSQYPTVPPSVLKPHSICFQWERSAFSEIESTRILTGEELPLTVENKTRIVKYIPSQNTEWRADESFMKTGYGWFVEVTGEHSTDLEKSQFMWIDDTGIRYFLAPDNDSYASEKQGITYNNVRKALGLETVTAVPIPWSIARLYAPGTTLSVDAARTEHMNLPVDVNQKLVPDQSSSGSGSKTDSDDTGE